MVYSQAGYCQCGREIWIEFLFDGTKWAARFMDDEHHEISQCPQCGAELDEDELDGV